MLLEEAESSKEKLLNDLKNKHADIIEDMQTQHERQLNNTVEDAQRLLRRMRLVEGAQGEVAAHAVVLDAAGQLRLGIGRCPVFALHQAQPPVIDRLARIGLTRRGGHTWPGALAKRRPAVLLNLRKQACRLLRRDILIHRAKRDRPAHPLMLDLGRPAAHPAQFAGADVAIAEHTGAPIGRLQPLIAGRLAGFDPICRRLLGHAWTALSQLSPLDKLCSAWPSGNSLDTLGQLLAVISRMGLFFAAKKGHFCFNGGS